MPTGPLEKNAVRIGGDTVNMIAPQILNWLTHEDFARKYGRSITCSHYGMDGPVFWPLFYVVRWGQRIRCPVCGRKVTRSTTRWAIRVWNRPGGEEAQVVKVTDKNAVLINGHPVALTDAQVRDLIAKATGQRKPKLKRAADIAWNHLTEHDDRDSVSKR